MNFQESTTSACGTVLASEIPERLTVLLVEDDESVRGFVGAVLRAENYNVVEARDGEEALDHIGRDGGTIDMILTDEVMPHLSGSRLIDVVTRAHPQIAFIIMSGYIADADARLHIEDAHRLFLAKPFSPDELIFKLQEAAGVAR